MFPPPSLLLPPPKILAEGAITAEEIDQGKLIDQHYYAIASKATILKPAELNVPADKFKAQFGLEWQTALDSGKVLNAMDGCAALGIDADEMDKQWGICKKAKKLIKFGGGFYCGLIEIEGKESYFIFNGFFMSMRAKFTAPGTSIYYYVVDWDPDALAWSDFRGSVLGTTDPVEAVGTSLRGQIYAHWESLGYGLGCLGRCMMSFCGFFFSFLFLFTIAALFFKSGPTAAKFI